MLQMEISVNAKPAQVWTGPGSSRVVRLWTEDTYTPKCCILLACLLIGVLEAIGCGGGPESRTRGATLAQVPPHTEGTVTARPSESEASPNEASRFTEEWGIEPIGINLSAAGYLLDFRYRVADPTKALNFVTRNMKPCLVDQESGARMFVPNPPKVGRLQQLPQEPIAGRIHFVLFANPGRFIKPGSKVTLIFGDCEIKNLIVNDPAQIQGVRRTAEKRRGWRDESVHRPIAAVTP